MQPTAPPPRGPTPPVPAHPLHRRTCLVAPQTAYRCLHPAPPSLCLRSGDTELVSGPNGERPDWWWTGRKPEAGAPGILPDGTLTSLPAPNLASVTRQQALDYFENTWLITEVLFSALQGEWGAWSWGVWGQPPAAQQQCMLTWTQRRPIRMRPA